jgi:hypothetical protein
MERASSTIVRAISPAIERASLRILIDSCFANLTEQLEISGPKVFLRRSLMQFTPVLRGDWTFLTPASDRDRER